MPSQIHQLNLNCMEAESRYRVGSTNLSSRSHIYSSPFNLNQSYVIQNGKPHLNLQLQELNIMNSFFQHCANVNLH